MDRGEGVEEHEPYINQHVENRNTENKKRTECLIRIKQSKTAIKTSIVNITSITEKMSLSLN